MKKRKNSRAKGARAEREAAKFLTRIGFPCRRTAQIRGKTGGCADLEFEDEKTPIHVEVKHDRKVHLNTVALVKACDQAVRDAKPGYEPVVMWKRDGYWHLSARASGVGSPWVTAQQADIEWCIRTLVEKMRAAIAVSAEPFGGYADEGLRAAERVGKV